ncbi:MAG: hypothetical protein QW841_01870 [Candidatus Aenigmatarchaeota archaeon]
MQIQEKKEEYIPATEFASTPTLVFSNLAPGTYNVVLVCFEPPDQQFKSVFGVSVS